MDDSLLSFTIIFAELGGVLLLLLIVWIAYYIYNIRKDGENSRELVKHVKEVMPKHRDKFTAHFKDEMELDDKKVDSNVDSLMRSEKKLYENLINISINKDTSLLKLTINDINALVNDYVRLLTLKEPSISNTDSDSRELIMRKENEALRLENESLQKRLDAEIETIESMMSEFSSMYEGGKKEGEQRVKNEMYKLKQSLNDEKVRVKSVIDGLDVKE